MNKRLYLGSLSFLLCFLLVFLFIITRNKEEIKRYKGDLPTKITNFLIVETSGGRYIWQFGAKDAIVDKNIAFLNNITFSMFEPDKNNNKKILLDVEAAYGRFFIESRNFSLKKNININFKGIEIKTHQLDFDNSRHIIKAEDKIYLINKKNNIEVRGKDMTILPYQGMISLKNSNSTLLSSSQNNHTYIYINSDKLYFDKKKEILVFEGDVLLEELINKTKSLEMKLDRIEILFQKANPKNKINNMTFTKEDVYIIQGNGDPIILTSKKENINIICKKIKYLIKEGICMGEDSVKINYLDISVFCDKFTYFIKEDKLKLIGNNKIKYKDNTITGNEIVIYPKEEKVEMEGKIRASIILTPPKK